MPQRARSSLARWKARFLRKQKRVKEASTRVDQAFSVGATGVEKELLRVGKTTQPGGHTRLFERG